METFMPGVSRLAYQRAKSGFVILLKVCHDAFMKFYILLARKVCINFHEILHKARINLCVNFVRHGGFHDAVKSERSLSMLRFFHRVLWDEIANVRNLSRCGPARGPCGVQMIRP